MSDFNIIITTFWDEHEIANLAFQELQLLNIIANSLL